MKYLASISALPTCLMSMVSFSASAQTGPLRVATWNLGWHVSQAELTSWIAQCSKSYVKDAHTGIWDVVEPQTPGARVGCAPEPRPRWIRPA